MKNLDMDDDDNNFEASKIPESQKKYILISVCLMSYLDFSGFGLPITLYPQVSSSRGWSSVLTGFVLGIFPFGGFFNSFLTGKIMRFYKKHNMLLMFLTITCLSKLLFGLVYFIEDPYIFLILSIVSRFLWGFSFSGYQTCSISIIPEVWPDSIINKLSLNDLFINSGLISGPLIGSLINYFFDFFWVLAIFSSIHFFLGIFVILKYLKIDAIATFANSKPTLSLKRISKNMDVMTQFFFQTLFLGSILWISSDFENHIIDDLGGTQTICACIYILDMVGFCTSLIIINKIFKAKVNRKKCFLLGSIISIIFNNLLGPAFFLGITNNTTGLACVSIAFYMLGLSHGMIAVISIPFYKELLESVFTEDPPELLVDMASGLFFAAYSLSEFVNSLVGGIVIEELGYNYASVVYSLILIVYFLIYWGKELFGQKYDQMSEEKEIDEEEMQDD